MRSGWKKFKKLLPLLTSRVFSLKTKSVNCTQRVLEVQWFMVVRLGLAKEDDMRRIDRAEMYMVRWMCNVKLKDRKSSSELQSHLGLESVREIMQCGRLRWFGHVERVENHHLVKRIRDLNVKWHRGRGKLQEDIGIRLSVLILHDKGLQRALALKLCCRGRLPSANPCLTHARMANHRR